MSVWFEDEMASEKIFVMSGADIHSFVNEVVQLFFRNEQILTCFRSEQNALAVMTIDP
ncbi:hypothetical protein PMm318_A42360 [Pseudomonas moorei]